MRILTYDVDDALILRYGRILMELSRNYSSAFEWARSEVHEEILRSVGLRRGIDEIECDRFNECLFELIKDGE